MNPAARLLLAHMRQPTSIAGSGLFLATTVALVTRQVSVKEAADGYTLALTMIAIPEPPPAAVAVQKADRVEVDGKPT